MRVWKKVRRLHLNVYTYRIKTRLQELVSTIRYFSRADLWSGFSAYRTSQDMIGFFFIYFFKYYWTNVLHVTFYTTIDLGAHFYRYFYETTDRCKSYLDQQIEHEIWFSRQLVWQYWQKYQTHSHNDTEILINALWHTSPSANNRHIKCHTIIFSYNILAIHPPLP